MSLKEDDGYGDKKRAWLRFNDVRMPRCLKEYTVRISWEHDQLQDEKVENVVTKMVPSKSVRPLQRKQYNSVDIHDS